MFDVGIGEIVLVLFASLFIFGPDRLPKVAAQAARALREIRGMAAGARAELTDALGPEFTDLGRDLGLGELRDLTKLRALDPRTSITKALLGTDEVVAVRPDPLPAPQPRPATDLSGGTDPGRFAFDPDAT